jgi:CheY-like chemotaxis protein
MDRKRRILLCEDLPEYSGPFVKCHRNDECEVVLVQEWNECKPTLQRLIDEGKEPDIILIDLYHPNEEANDDQMRSSRQKIEDLRTEISKSKASIEKGFLPHGIKVIRQARELCPNTPIAASTRTSLMAIVGDDGCNSISQEYKCEWFLKGQGESYEKYRLETMIAVKRDTERVSEREAEIARREAKVEEREAKVREREVEVAKREAEVAKR